MSLSFVQAHVDAALGHDRGAEVGWALGGVQRVDHAGDAFVAQLGRADLDLLEQFGRNQGAVERDRSEAKV